MQKNLAKLFNSFTSEDLKRLVPLKEKIDILKAKKSKLEKDLAAVDEQISSVQGSLAKALGHPRAGRSVRRRRRRRIAQPSLASVIVDVLKERKKPLMVNEIHDAVVAGKKYKSRAKDFKNNLRVLLYRNMGGLFKQVGPGKFGLKEYSKGGQKRAVPPQKKR